MSAVNMPGRWKARPNTIIGGWCVVDTDEDLLSLSANDLWSHWLCDTNTEDAAVTVAIAVNDYEERYGSHIDHGLTGGDASTAPVEAAEAALGAQLEAPGLDIGDLDGRGSGEAMLAAAVAFRELVLKVSPSAVYASADFTGDVLNLKVHGPSDCFISLPDGALDIGPTGGDISTAPIEAVDEILAWVETNPNPRLRFLDVSAGHADTSFPKSWRSVRFVLDDRYDVSAHGETMLAALLEARRLILHGDADGYRPHRPEQEDKP